MESLILDEKAFKRLTEHPTNQKSSRYSNCWLEQVPDFSGFTKENIKQ
jgi:hypothetical protein